MNYFKYMASFISGGMFAVDCDALYCSANGQTMRISDAILSLFSESVMAGGVAKKLTVTDNNGAFKQQVSGKQSVILKASVGNDVVHYPVTFSTVNGVVTQLSGFAILNVADIGYCEVKYNFLFGNSNEVNIMIQGTLIQV